MSAPQPPSSAREVFGSRLPLAERYAEILATAGVERGVIGPREVDRLWDRHLLNCAVLGLLPADLLPPGARVIDVGSGAGLPGVPLALARPDLEIVLLEPLERRAIFLSEVCSELGLSTVAVYRGRAEDPAVLGDLEPAPVVTARAVAPMDRLARWCLPLVARGGVLLALKGASVADELDRTRPAVVRAGAAEIDIVECGGGVIDQPTTVVAVHRRAGSAPTARNGSVAVSSGVSDSGRVKPASPPRPQRGRDRRARGGKSE